MPRRGIFSIRNIMRQLATIRKIDNILPIDGADQVVIAVVDGWTVVVKKDEFKIGDLCLYFEIDSYLPVIPAYDFIKERCYKKMGTETGLRIKTIRLRQQLSQGLLLPLTHDLGPAWSEALPNLKQGDDVTELLGVRKYELPIPAELAGQVRGNFPSFIPKTDQPRCQNMLRDIFVDNVDSEYEVTIKLDGTSFTGYHNDSQLGVCSRNWDLQINGSNKGKTLIKTFINSGLSGALQKIGRNIAVQAELMGPGILRNREGFNSPKLFIFDVYDIDAHQYLTPPERYKFVELILSHSVDKDVIHHAPILHQSVRLKDLNINNITELLAYAEGPSYVHKSREGLVYKRIDGQFSFKTISNAFLLKNEQ